MLPILRILWNAFLSIKLSIRPLTKCSCMKCSHTWCRCSVPYRCYSVKLKGQDTCLDYQPENHQKAGITLTITRSSSNTYITKQTHTHTQKKPTVHTHNWSNRILQGTHNLKRADHGPSIQPSTNYVLWMLSYAHLCCAHNNNNNTQKG